MGPDDPPAAPVAYRYRLFEMGEPPEEGGRGHVHDTSTDTSLARTVGKPPKEGDDDTRVKMVVRTELDAVAKGTLEEGADPLPWAAP